MRFLVLVSALVIMCSCSPSYSFTVKNMNQSSTLRLGSHSVTGRWKTVPSHFIGPRSHADVRFDGNLARVNYIEKGFFRDKSITMKVGYADSTTNYCSTGTFINNMCYSCSLCDSVDAAGTHVFFSINTWF
ncbi:hypothetical protein GEMRC1_004360 [Eukaryota sp. GEM-RC1]